MFTTEILVGSDHANLADAFRLRHEIFVVESGWEDLRKADGLERDQFDDEHAVHFLVYEGARLVGYQRLLPTTRPYLLTEIYPHLCDSAPPSDPSIYEWTRCAAVHEYRGRGSAVGPVLGELMLSMVEWGLSCGVKSVVVEFLPVQILKLIQANFITIPLGISQEVGGQDLIALRAHFDERALLRLQTLSEQAKALQKAS